MAGERYYFEAFMKEGGGGDDLGVTMQKPGKAIPANGSSPVSAIDLAVAADPAAASVNITQQPQDYLLVPTGSSVILLDENFDSGGGVGWSAPSRPRWSVDLRRRLMVGHQC